jgi:ABC-type uncharacterized transport system permease subunit
MIKKLRQLNIFYKISIIILFVACLVYTLNFFNMKMVDGIIGSVETAITVSVKAGVENNTNSYNIIFDACFKVKDNYFIIGYICYGIAGIAIILGVIGIFKDRNKNDKINTSY